VKSIELVCGKCGSYMAMEDAQSSLAILSLAHRFSNAHVRCGFVTPGQPDDVQISQETQETP
jgi:hypothetical protein